MLSSKKGFVVTVGNYGAVIALHDGGEIKSKIFLDELTKEAEIDLENLFAKNHFLDIKILLDTIDQSYRKKAYPLIRKNDLKQIIKRDLSADGDKESLKNYIIYDSKKGNKNKTSFVSTKRESLFVSASTAGVVSKWIEFLLEMPNQISGIYMLPIETFNIIRFLKNDIKTKSKPKNSGSENIYFFIIQNKVSGFRQVIFSEQGIIFTRLVNYNLSEKDFSEKYEQDIYSTFEYLKRLIPDVRIIEISIVNILSKEALDIVKNIVSTELNFANYTPHEAATKIGYKKILPENANYCDLLISKIFIDSKKILKFTTPKIKILDKFFLTLNTSYYFNAVLSFAIFLASITVFIFNNNDSDILVKAEAGRLNAMREYSSIKLPDSEKNGITENGNSVDIERIIDFGKVDEVMNSIGTDITKFYINLRFLKNNDVKLTGFKYSLPSFDMKNPKTGKYQVYLKGNLGNKSGDIDDLFKAFDSLIAKAKKNFSKEKLTYNEIPRNIDFVQKYYTFPIELTISK